MTGKKDIIKAVDGRAKVIIGLVVVVTAGALIVGGFNNFFGKQNVVGIEDEIVTEEVGTENTDMESVEIHLAEMKISTTI